ncbi:MAG: hypothetical protein GY726_15450 [Proteobacteria bacterium]|nr:hypothetical protein [Pseudomonadota bacterium]
MQPRTLVFLLIILPLFAVNGAFLLSASESSIPWCIPYIDGCTTISRAARSGNAIFLFRVTMIAHALLLIWFWIYVKHWLAILHGTEPRIAKVISWLGITGVLAMLVYIDFLGTEGEINRFMRRHGIMLFFTLTPMAQLLLYREHLRFKHTALVDAAGALRMQTLILMLMLAIGLTSVVVELAGVKTHTIENIIEWNFTLLMNLYFVGMLSIWGKFRVSFSD